MKRNAISKSAMPFLVIGLLLTSLTPIISRHFHWPDLVKGFLAGLALALEMIAIIKMSRSNKKTRVC
jgi:hypothetical protein